MSERSFLRLSDLTEFQRKEYYKSLAINKQIKSKGSISYTESSNDVIKFDDLLSISIVKQYGKDNSILDITSSKIINNSINSNSGYHDISNIQIPVNKYRLSDLKTDNVPQEPLLACVITGKPLTLETAYLSDMGFVDKSVITKEIGTYKVSVSVDSINKNERDKGIIEPIDIEPIDNARRRGRAVLKITKTKSYLIPLFNNIFYTVIDGKKEFIENCIKITIDILNEKPVNGLVVYNKNINLFSTKVRYGNTVDTQKEISIITSTDIIKKLLDEKKLFINKYSMFYTTNKSLLKTNLIPSRNNWYFFNNAKYYHDEDAGKKYNIKYGLESPTNIISEQKPYTFGVEIETVSGTIPPHIAHELNVSTSSDMSCNIKEDLDNRDFGASGAEYVSGVLIGDAGFAHLLKICNVISEYTTVNKTCSVHVHLGNGNFNKADIVYLYKILQDIENDMFSIVPKSRRSSVYAKRMKQIDINLPVNECKDKYKIKIQKEYNKIFKMITFLNSYPLPNSSVNRKRNHPHGSRAGYDKKSPRYWWVNMLPLLYNAKREQLGRFKNKASNHTLEIRLHGASTNYAKIRNWILLCMAILNVAENYKHHVTKERMTIEKLLILSYPKKAEQLINYFKERRNYFHELRDENDEYKPSQNPQIKKLTDVSTYL